MNQWCQLKAGLLYRLLSDTVPIRRNLTGNAFANGNGTDTERERERVWNGNRTRSVKRSLLGFFWSVLYLQHNAEHFFLLLVKFSPWKFFFSCWLEISNSTFFRLSLYFFTFSLLDALLCWSRVFFCYRFSTGQAVGWHLVHWQWKHSMRSDFTSTASFLGGSCNSESFKASSFSAFYIAEWLEAFHSVKIKLLDWQQRHLKILIHHKTCHNGNRLIALSFPYMECGSQSYWNNTTRYSRKQRRKRASCREKKPNLSKLRLVYKVKHAWELRPQ